MILSLQSYNGSQNQMKLANWLNVAAVKNAKA